MTHRTFETVAQSGLITVQALGGEAETLVIAFASYAPVHLARGIASGSGRGVARSGEEQFGVALKGQR